MAVTNLPPDSQLDILYRNSVREARFIFGTWACCFVYTISYCYLMGYVSHESLPSAHGGSIGSLLGELESFNRDPAQVSYPLGLGIPDWVFYGIVIPWGLCVLATFLYGLFLFSEDELGGEDEEGETAE